MKIKQSRITNLKKLNFLKEGSKFKIIVRDISRFEKEIIKFGFKEDLIIGEKILPTTISLYSRRNAELYFTIDKKAPKESYTQTIYWKRNLFDGRNSTKEVTGFSDIEKQRYKRETHLPFSVEFIILEEDGVKSIYSDEMVYNIDEYEKIKNTINMVLKTFGECDIISEFSQVKEQKVINLTWDILPKGDYPWSVIKEKVKEISGGRKNTNKEMMLRNCELINSYDPDFIAYGQAGYKGYIIFGFSKKGIYILESVIPNNATYIFEDNWENLSKLSKAEILSENLHKDRVVHNSRWQESFTRIMEENN